MDFTDVCVCVCVWGGGGGGEAGGWGPGRCGERGGNCEPLPGVMGNRGIISLISGEHISKNEGNRGTKVIFGSREHRKLRL